MSDGANSNDPLDVGQAARRSPVIEFTVRMRVDNEPAFWDWALSIWRRQWGPREPLPENACSLAGIALEALVLSNPTWGSELAIEFEDYSSRVVEGDPLPYPPVLTAEEPDDQGDTNPTSMK